MYSALGLTSWFGTKTSNGSSFLGSSRCGHPLGSRVCSFSIVAKDWQFLLEFHLQLMVICQFLWQSGHWSCFPLLYVSSSYGWVHHVSNALPFLIRSFGVLLEGSVS